jgi:hypothetical protein
METNFTLLILALIATLSLLAVVAVDIILTMREADTKGCSIGTPVANASKT